MAIYQKGDLKIDEAVVGTKTAADWASQGFTLVNQPTAQQAQATPTTTNTPQIAPQAPQAPQGSVAINGAEFNTREKQQANFTNIQPIGNTLYGIPKAPIVPDIIPQKDLGNALSSETSAKVGAEAQGLVGFNEQQVADLNKANLRVTQGTATETDLKNLEYAKSKGWQPAETKEETLKPKTSVPEPTPTKTTSDLILEIYSNIGNIRAEAKAEAMRDTKLMEKGEAIATASTLVNRFRTELQNNEILDIKEQDVIRAKPILTAQIQGQLEGLSREQKLDAMIMQNNYNNSLVELQIAQGNYDRAREIVKETADDAFETAGLQLDALMFKNQIEDKEYDRMRADLEYERQLGLEGYAHIKSPEALKGLKESDIFRDPVSGKIYMKPAPKVAQIIEVNGRKIGIDENGNKIRDYGSSLSTVDTIELLEAGYTIDENGNPVKINENIASADAYSIASAIKQVESNGNYEASGASGEYGAYQFMPSTWDSWSNDYANNVLGQSAVLEPTPQNQDAVAQYKIQQWLDNGLTPQQIAAKWNSGSEFGWENKIGTNSQGVAYNVPSYVNKVTNALGGIVGTKTSQFSQTGIDWAENIRDGKASLDDITSEVEKSNPGLKSEVNSILKTLPPSDAQIKEAQDFVDKLVELRDHSGLESSVGPVAVARGGIFGVQGMWGKKDAFLGKADTLISKKALNSLIEAKSQGATFGALSDTEMNILKSAGTTLGAWSMSKSEKKGGKLKGFDVDEKTFKEELNSLISDYEKLLSRANISQSLDSYLESNPNKVDEYNIILSNNPNLTEEEILQVIQ